jgi:hypothetical protein
VVLAGVDHLAARVQVGAPRCSDTGWNQEPWQQQRILGLTRLVVEGCP